MTSEPTKTAVITGATGGIGSAIARNLAADGMAVTVGYRSSKRAAEEVVDTMAGAGHTTARMDVSDSGSLTQLGASFDELDVLVNCAGVTQPVAHDDLDGLTDETIDQIFQTNWRGPFACIRAFRPALEASGDAVVINISSIAAVTGQGSNVAYCASKAALDSMTRSLGRSLAPAIRVVSVSPGWVRGEYADRMEPAILEGHQSQTPLQKLATPEDVASAVNAVVNYLPMTTGSIVAVDGGRQLGAS